MIRTSRAGPRTKRAAPEQRLQPVFPGNKRNRLKPRLQKIIRTSLAPRVPALRLSRRSGPCRSYVRRPHRVGRRSPSRCPCSEPPQMIRTSRAGPRTKRAAPEQRLQPVFPGNRRNRLKPRLRKIIRTSLVPRVPALRLSRRSGPCRSCARGRTEWDAGRHRDALAASRRRRSEHREPGRARSERRRNSGFSRSFRATGATG